VNGYKNGVKIRFSKEKMRSDTESPTNNRCFGGLLTLILPPPWLLRPRVRRIITWTIIKEDPTTDKNDDNVRTTRRTVEDMTERCRYSVVCLRSRFVFLWLFWFIYFSLACCFGFIVDVVGLQTKNWCNGLAGNTTFRNELPNQIHSVLLH